MPHSFKIIIQLNSKAPAASDSNATQNSQHVSTTVTVSDTGKTQAFGSPNSQASAYKDESNPVWATVS